MAIKNEGISVTLEIINKDGTTQRVSSHSKRRIKQGIQASVAAKVKKYRLRVSYTASKQTNEGEYQTKGKVLQAYRAFTNKDEVDFVNKYWRG